MKLRLTAYHGVDCGCPPREAAAIAAEERAAARRKRPQGYTWPLGWEKRRPTARGATGPFPVHPVLRWTETPKWKLWAAQRRRENGWGDAVKDDEGGEE